jgi:hypothetical protein
MNNHGMSKKYDKVYNLVTKLRWLGYSHAKVMDKLIERKLANDTAEADQLILNAIDEQTRRLS